MRKKGSVKFDPYYKIQWWDETSLTWVDIQKSYPTPEEARVGYPKGKKCRVMEVTDKGRRPLPD